MLSCKNVLTINGSLLESEIIKQINQWIDSYCELNEIEIRCRHGETIERLNTESDLIRLEIKKKEKVIMELYDDKSEGIISKERFVDLSSNYEKIISDLKENLIINGRKVESIRLNGINDNRRMKLIEKYTCVENLTRPMVEEFIDVVFIGEKINGQERAITIHWAF